MVKDAGYILLRIFMLALIIPLFLVGVVVWVIVRLAACFGQLLCIAIDR